MGRFLPSSPKIQVKNNFRLISEIYFLWQIFQNPIYYFGRVIDDCIILKLLFLGLCIFWQTAISLLFVSINSIRISTPFPKAFSILDTYNFGVLEQNNAFYPRMNVTLLLNFFFCLFSLQFDLMLRLISYIGWF